MRRFIFPGLAALLFIVIRPPCSLLAQFQDPTKDELQMTADPKAPGAASVYLYREDVTDQASKSRTFYERVKILTELGKEMATVDMPYEPATDKVEIQGRTIHADGTIIPLSDKASDLADLKSKGYQRNKMVFTLPSAEVGSILEYRITVRHSDYVDDPTWMIQQQQFVHKAHYAYKRLSDYPISVVSRIGSDAKVLHDKGNYTLDLTDVPALPDEDWMPPLNTFKWRVSFFYSNFSTSQQFWDKAEKTWDDFVRDFTRPTGSLKTASAQMVAAGDTETQKAQKIYAAVMKLENTDFTREKAAIERKKEKIKDIHNAQDVWRDQSGTSDELALLYVALCRSAGLNVKPMKVVDRARALFDIGLLTSRQLDDYIAVGQLDGKEIYLDPGSKMCPFGMLSWRHMLASGFRLNDKAVTIAHTPSGSSKSSSLDRIAYLTIDETGTLQGTVRIVMGGQYALHWRQIAIGNDEEEVKKQFNEWMKTYIPDGVQVDFDHFIGLDDYNANLLGIVRVSGSVGTITGRHMFLPGLFFQSKAKHPFVAQDKRTTPIDVLYAKSESDDVTYRLPPGYKMESSPQTTNIAWADHANFAISTTTEADGVDISRSLSSNYTVLDPKEYGNLHDFYQKLAVADQQQVVLARPVPAKAN